MKIFTNFATEFCYTAFASRSLWVKPTFPFMATDWRWCWTPKRLKVHLPTFTTGFVLPSIKIVYYQHLLVSFEELLSLRLSDHFALVVGCINNNWLDIFELNFTKRPSSSLHRRQKYNFCPTSPSLPFFLFLSRRVVSSNGKRKYTDTQIRENEKKCFIANTFSHHTSSQCCKARRFDRVAPAIFK